MVQVLPPVQIKLRSKPYSMRTGLMPMIVGVAVGWVFSIIWLSVGIFALVYNMLWGIILMCSTLAFSTYLGFMSYSLVRDAHRQFTFELTESEAVLNVLDGLTKKRSTQMVLLDDVSYIEYYPYRDSCSMILHAPYTHMEVPLWPLGEQALDAVDFLRGRGIQIVNVQMDDAIPE